ncbi:MAG: zinc protease [marine bacterium B5-7]|nr:MAG: zinc protease [marine bacterium B5-7]
MKVTPSHGLEVVTPKRFRQRDIDAFIHANQSWIEKQLHVLQEMRVKHQRPSQIKLRALQEDWTWHVIPMQASRIRTVEKPDFQLAMMGPIDDEKIQKKYFMQWLRKKAKNYLLPLLDELSQTTQLPYATASVRAQTSRWGSCSENKTVSLNCKLLFLPDSVVRHVLLHELCHTVHLNHSRDFWQLLQSLDSRSHQHRLQLKTAQQLVPQWLEI